MGLAEWMMENFGTREQHVAALVPHMEALGAVRLEATYSGGNDEGGVEMIHLFGEGEAILETPARGTHRPKTDEDTYWNSDGMVFEENPIWDLADRILAVEFGTWAGDFSAYGKLFVDAKERRCWQEGSIAHPVDDSDSWEERF